MVIQSQSVGKMENWSCCCHSAITRDNLSENRNSKGGAEPGDLRENPIHLQDNQPHIKPALLLELSVA